MKGVKNAIALELTLRVELAFIASSIAKTHLPVGSVTEGISIAKCELSLRSECVLSGSRHSHDKLVRLLFMY